MDTKEISVKDHASLREKNIQDIIAKKPSVLGIGNLTLVGKEVIQKDGGKPDLLFRTDDSKKIYEVEIQLGKLDGLHLIKTVGYWINERKKTPQYKHCAVLIAEVITEEMRDIIELCMGNVSIIILKMTAYEHDNKIVDLKLEKVYENMCAVIYNNGSALKYEFDYEPFEERDRQYWEKKVSKETLTVADNIYIFLKENDPAIEMYYTKDYIGFRREETKGFVFIEIKKRTLTLKLVLKQSNDNETEIKKADFKLRKYQEKGRVYPITITENDLKNKDPALKKLLKMTYEYNVKTNNI